MLRGSTLIERGYAPGAFHIHSYSLITRAKRSGLLNAVHLSGLGSEVVFASVMVAVLAADGTSAL